MKKIISVLLSLLMVFSLLSAGVSAANETNELKITVATDLHYNLTYGEYKDSGYKDTDYKHVPSNGQLWIESMLIVDAFLAEVAKNDSEILLIPGDLTDHGNNDEHLRFAEILKNFEATSGKRVYVVPGNHDYHSSETEVTPSDFAEYYAEFGYSEAIARDTASASYVVDLNNDYRLLAVDSCLPGSGESGIDEERAAWIAEQAEKAEKDGKKLISMMHHNLLDHFIFGDLLHPGSCVDGSLGLPEIYAKYGVRYNFVGHTHAQDIKSYTGTSGTTIYDVLTSSLNLYPLPYRNVSFGDEVVIKTEFIKSVDISSKKDIISDNCFKLASEDFQAYALACSQYGLDKVITSYTQEENMINLLKLDRKKDADLCETIKKILPAFRELIDTPLYSKGAGSVSLESIADKYRLDFPETDIGTFRELAMFFYQAYVTGDENFGIFSAEYVLLTAALSTILNEILADVSGEEYASLLNYLVRLLNLRAINSFNSYIADSVSRIEGVNIFVSALGSSVLLLFTTDEAPEDNNVILPGYTDEVPDEVTLSLWERITSFFKSIIEYIRRLFGIGK